VLVPSNSERHPAARCSAVSGVAPDAVLVAAGTLFPICVQPAAMSTNCEMIAARAAAPCIMYAS
jgi:hypothetical protein